MKKFLFITFVLSVLLIGCKPPERPKPNHKKPRIFYPETEKKDSVVVPDSVIQQALENEVRTRVLTIFQNVLSLYNAHSYNAIDKKALGFCTEAVKQKYATLMREWNALSPEEQAEYIEGPSLWWYFIGGNIDTRSGRKLTVTAKDIDIVCVDNEIAVLHVAQKVSEMEFTYCKVVLSNVNNKWLVDDLIPEAIGGGGDSRSFMNDHW